MRTFDVSLPELFFVAATRGMAGAGVGLLLSERLRRSKRKSVGLTLLTIGALTTIPIAMTVFGRTRPRLPAD